MIITTALANEIVARAMAIIHHNVNVIDHHGQIIASGERHRIGEQHEIAREVIRTGKRICINNTAEAARFQNVHPGINHPIIYGHSRFCNTDFDDKLACLNLSGV
ncbi:hypothetical protein BM280_26795 [Klebsiella michiganensis]|nr:hypothetical protein BM280_26795 [Klebsiella michiganensis]